MGSNETLALNRLQLSGHSPHTEYLFLMSTIIYYTPLGKIQWYWLLSLNSSSACLMAKSTSFICDLDHNSQVTNVDVSKPVSYVNMTIPKETATHFYNSVCIFMAQLWTYHCISCLCLWVKKNLVSCHITPVDPTPLILSKNLLLQPKLTHCPAKYWKFEINFKSPYLNNRFSQQILMFEGTVLQELY